MKVKICGITDVNTALQAVSLGADAIGFVFAESRRKIDPVLAGEIAEQLPAHVEKIGVFVNETKERIEEIASLAKLTMVQLHGEESSAFCESLSLPVIKALNIGSKDDLNKINEFSTEWILLDSQAGKYRGGNGTSFNWELLTGETFPGKKIILAGGLNAGNVEKAIELARPYMVDVSSGVETEGKKDCEKIREFIKNAKKIEKLEEQKR
jgi:phosphoribosylanthranilate isomerase